MSNRLPRKPERSPLTEVFERTLHEMEDIVKRERDLKALKKARVVVKPARPPKKGTQCS